MSADLKNIQKEATVNSKDIILNLADGKAMINDALVISADVKASNGVVHVFDKVILPPSE